MGSGLWADIEILMGSDVGSRLVGLIGREVEDSGTGPKMDGIVLSVDKKLGELGARPKMDGV